MTQNRFDYQIRITYWVIALLIVVGISYDLVITWNDVPNDIDSISAVAKRLGWRYPVLPFAFTGLAAHFWVNYDGYVWGWPADFYAMGVIHALWWIGAELTRPYWAHTDTGVLVMMIASMLAGLVTWAVFFPQRPPSIDEEWQGSM